MAHQEPPSVDSPADPLKAIHDVRSIVKSGKPEPSLPRGTLVGLPREKGTILRRLRTGTAATNAFLHRMKKRLHRPATTATRKRQWTTYCSYTRRTELKEHRCTKKGKRGPKPHHTTSCSQTEYAKSVTRLSRICRTSSRTQASWNVCNHPQYIVTRQRKTLRNSPSQGASPAHASKLTARLT